MRCKVDGLGSLALIDGGQEKVALSETRLSSLLSRRGSTYLFVELDKSGFELFVEASA